MAPQELEVGGKLLWKYDKTSLSTYDPLQIFDSDTE